MPESLPVPQPPEREAAPPGPIRDISADKRRSWLLVNAMTLVFIVIAVAGGWTYLQVRGSLREMRTAGLTSLVESESRAVLIWIDEKKRDALRWASTAQVRRPAAELAAMARRGDDSRTICAAPAQRALRAELAPFTSIEETAAFHLITRDGLILASQFEENCGRRIASADLIARLAPVFSRRPVFIPPWFETDRMGLSGALDVHHPLDWVEAPVLGDQGEVFAALGFGRYTSQGFAKLMSISAPDTTREAYAFDVRGLMLSESRYTPALREAGRLGQDESSVLRIEVRDPTDEKHPLTSLARQALDGFDVGEISGAIVEPYRNYRGVMVIGAWRRLVEKRLVIAVEIEAAEAFAPLQHVQIAFGALLALALASTIAAGALSLVAIRLRMREARRVGAYVIEGRIGGGGMSDVYRARHALLKRPAAVKVLKGHLASDEVTTRFEREARLCSRLTHPNTIEIFDFGRTRDGQPYYAMEYLRGVSLEDLVARDGPQPVARTIHLMRQACGSLREAHGLGLVHRDIKPQNLMLCVQGGSFDLLKVVDFGLVKETRDTDTRDITQYAKVLGTPLYMAPERLRNPADADARSDIYGLAAVAAFLLTGRRLFEAATEHDLIHQVLDTVAPTPTQQGARDVPAELEALIARSLSKDREARPASIAEFDHVLAELATRHPWSEEEARAWWESRASALAVDWQDPPPSAP
ncbi:serine/threonine-protein kinase [Usitatibacter palustris]|nr:serine/threonine-protein kinase [Usitatibacter palustris]